MLLWLLHWQAILLGESAGEDEPMSEAMEFSWMNALGQYFSMCALASERCKAGALVDLVALIEEGDLKNAVWCSVLMALLQCLISFFQSLCLHFGRP